MFLKLVYHCLSTFHVQQGLMTVMSRAFTAQEIQNQEILFFFAALVPPRNSGNTSSLTRVMMTGNLGQSDESDDDVITLCFMSNRKQDRTDDRSTERDP